MAKKKLIGRTYELTLLENLYKKNDSQLLVIYGRRRVGKSTLIQTTATQHDATFIYLEGIENQPSSSQIQKFIHDLQEQIDDPLLKSYKPKSWEEVFDYLSNYFQNSQKKVIICFDEFQWLAANRSLLVSLIKSYWDNKWKKQNVKLVLCGSIASFMLNKVIKSKALYGRIDQEILLDPLKPSEAKEFFKSKRSKQEILKYLLTLGSIPRYLELIDLNKSFNQNMNKLCFSKSGFFIDEVEKIFFSQFKEAKNYLNIVKALQTKPLSLTELSKKIKVKPGGSFQNYLRNLEDASLISSYTPLGSKSNSKLKKYKLLDEFLTFYFKYMDSNLNVIKKSEPDRLFEQLCENKWKPWLGLAFERFCCRYALELADRMGFANKVIDFGPYYKSGQDATQIDLIYKRSDQVITICEIKFHEKKISTSIIPELEQKINLYPIPNNHSVEKALITVNNIEESLRDTEYFHYVLDLDDILG